MREGHYTQGKALQQCYSSAPRKGMGDDMLIVLILPNLQVVFGSLRHVLTILSPLISLISKSTASTLQRRDENERGKRHAECFFPPIGWQASAHCVQSSWYYLIWSQKSPMITGVVLFFSNRRIFVVLWDILQELCIIPKSDQALLGQEAKGDIFGCLQCRKKHSSTAINGTNVENTMHEVVNSQFYSCLLSSQPYFQPQS